MISKQQVEHMAKLARIELIDQEKRKFQKELSSILDYVEKLNKVDTSKIERIAQITGLKDMMRDDEVQSSRPKVEDPRRKASGPKSKVQSKLLKNVPSKKDNYIKVPKILE